MLKGIGSGPGLGARSKQTGEVIGTHTITNMASLQSWVTKKDHQEYKSLPEGFVSVSCTHNFLKKELKELRLDLHATVASVKEKLYRHCGTLPKHMALVLKSGGRVICEIDDDRKKLGFYSVKSGMEIKIVDLNPMSLAKGGGLEDVSLVEKYVMSDKEYDKRDNSLRKFRKEQLKKDPKFKFYPKQQAGGKGNATKTAGDALSPGTAEDVKDMKLGDRCELNPGSRRGAISFVGEVNFSPGFWIGVVLDEPVGKNDGVVRGKRYFTCPPKRGLMVHPAKVAVGDYPEIDELEDSSDEEL